MVNSSPSVYSNGTNGIKTAHLRLYAPCAAGIKYLLAQSPDTEHLVPDVQEAEWEVVGTKKDVKLYKEVAKPPEKLNKTRGIGIIKAPTDFVASVIADDYEAWDDTIKELRVLNSERDPDTGALVEIIWTRYCLQVPLLKDRDFVYREVTQQLPGGVHIIFGQSITPEEEAQCTDVPHPASVIRGEMGASGWVIAPAEGGQHSNVTYVALTDLKGQFPQVLVNQYSTDVPLTVNDVRKVVTAKLKAQAKQAAKGCAGGSQIKPG